MEQVKYLIVGSSAAGMAAAEALRTYDPFGTLCIVSEEIDSPYYRPMIPYLISGKKEVSQIYLKGQGAFQHNNLDIRLHSRATALHPSERVVQIASGDTIRFERLLIATGSRPYIPSDIIGADISGVYALRTLDDARRISTSTVNTKHAVMLGGGLLNLKAAFALLACNIKVSLIVYSPEVLSQLMEPEDAFLIRRALDSAGLEILTGVNAQQIIGSSNGVKAVVLDNGTEIECQMVCIGKGVRPNVEWLTDSGIRLAEGVVVDRYTKTNIDGVYAAGDVAVTFDPITEEPIMTGLWTNAMEMGRCSGRNMAGKPTQYGGTFGIMNATQVAEMPFVSMGIVHTQGKDIEVHRSQTPFGYRKLIFAPDESRLVGALFVGDIGKSGMYRSLIREKTDISSIKKNIINHTFHYGHMLYSKKSGVQ